MKNDCSWFDVNRLYTDHQYKCYKYAHLFDRQNLGYSVKYFAVAIDCRAMTSEPNSKCLHAFYKSILGIKFTAILEI